MQKKILVVDDEPDILKVVVFRLKKKGYEIRSATNGQEALDALKEQKPDLVILDLRLPIIDGIEVGKRIKADDTLSHIPVILLSASSDTIQKSAQECRADDYLTKPFDVEELLIRIARLLSP